METNGIENTDRIRVLWLSPNLNHYKARLIGHLHGTGKIEVTVLAGSGRQNMGDSDAKENWHFETLQTNIPKSRFGLSPSIMFKTLELASQYDWLLIPKEIKNLPLILTVWLAFKLRSIFGSAPKLISYSHPVYLSGPRKASFLLQLLNRILFKMYDSCVLYTEGSMKNMVEDGFISAKQAHYANNTVDTELIDKVYRFQYPDPQQPTILFIGRLIPSKKVGLLMAYYRELKKRIPALRLVVIGDGPDRDAVQELLQTESDVTWTGMLSQEQDIAEHMKMAWLVFIPGASGLSINHAFAYGRPYVTVADQLHGPELEYVREGINGHILSGDKATDIQVLETLLTNFDKHKFDAANESGKSYSIAAWSEQMTNAFVN